jgi:hypothetical protein
MEMGSPWRIVSRWVTFLNDHSGECTMNILDLGFMGADSHLSPTFLAHERLSGWLPLSNGSKVSCCSVLGAADHCLSSALMPSLSPLS